MSKEEQYILATLFGYEAYRDGYTVGQTDSSGEMYTKQSLENNIGVATIASMFMVERIKYENDWFGDLFERFAFDDFIEKDINKHSFFSNNDSLLSDNDFLEEFDPKGIMNFNTVNRGDYQNDYKGIPLFLSKTKAMVDAINKQRAIDAFIKYKGYSKDRLGIVELLLLDLAEEQFEAFKKNEKLLKKNGYIEEEFITISKSGCTFMSTKYGLETILGEQIDTNDFHNYIIKNNYFINGNLLSNKLMATIMTSYLNNKYTVSLLTGEKGVKPNELMSKITSPNEQYLIHLRIANPKNPKEGTHSVMVTNIEYTKDREGNISIDKFNVANPERPSKHINAQASYLPSQIFRCDLYLVTKNY